jgi:hypothetical protein
MFGGCGINLTNSQLKTYPKIIICGNSFIGNNMQIANTIEHIYCTQGSNMKSKQFTRLSEGMHEINNNYYFNF